MTICSCCFKVNPDPKGKREALAEAEIALSKMNTPGWKIITHHNINWYWRLQNRYLTIYPGYSALMADERYASAGPAYWTPRAARRFRDPNKAAAYAFAAAERFHNRITAIIGEQRDAFRGVFARYEELQKEKQLGIPKHHHRPQRRTR